MNARAAFLTLFVVAGVALAGCTGTQGAGSTTTATTTTAASTTTTTATTTTATTAGPQKGDNLLSVSAVNASTAMAVDESARANFSELNASQRGVFRQAYDCSCNVNQDVFRYNDDDRTKYVDYDGQWYYLRVSIV